MNGNVENVWTTDRERVRFAHTTATGTRRMARNARSVTAETRLVTQGQLSALLRVRDQTLVAALKALEARLGKMEQAADTAQPWWRRLVPGTPSGYER